MRYIVTLIILLTLSFVGSSQISFYKLYTNNGSDFGQGIVQLEDSSYVVTGSSSSFTAGSQAFLLKVDSLGNYLWSNHYGGVESESGRRVLYQPNFGYFICGFTNSIGAGGFDFYLAKTDLSGNLEWENAYGGTGWEKVHDAALTRDSGVILIGETSSNPTDNLDFYIVKTDKYGDTVWTKTMGGAGDDYLSAIRRYDDSTYAVVGRLYNEDSLFTKAYVAYFGDDGTFYWQDTIGGNENYWFNDLCFESGRIVAIGGTEGPSKDGIDLLFYHCLVGGNPLGITEIPNPGSHENMLITTYGPSDNFYIPYYTNDQWTFPGGVDLHTAKYLTNFAWQSSFPIANIGPDIAGQIIRTSDGGAIMTGYTTGIVSGGNEIFIAKIGPNDMYPNPQVDSVVHDLVAVEKFGDITTRIYPNPATDVINIEIDDLSYDRIQLFNSEGRIVHMSRLNKITSINTAEFETGWYILEISSDANPAIRKKVVIQK